MWVSRDCHATDALELNMYESSTKETTGCASKLLAHEDLGHLRKPIVGIYKPSSIMKIPTSIWKWLNMRLSIMKNMVLLWSTSVEKDSSNCPFFFFLLFLGLYFFLWPFLIFFFWRGFLYLAFPHMGQCSNNDDHHTFITTRYYNSILQQKSMTLYECLRWCTGMCNETKVTCIKRLCMVALPQIRCQLHDHAMAIWQYDACHMNGTGESCMAIYLGMAVEMPW